MDSFVVNSFKFATLIRNTAISKNLDNLISSAQELEILFFNANANIALREKQINCFRLISIVGVIGNATLIFKRDVSSDSRNTK